MAPIVRSCVICADDAATEKPLRFNRGCGQHDICEDCLLEIFRQALNDESQYPPRCCRDQRAVMLIDDYTTGVCAITDMDFITAYKKKEQEYAVHPKNRIYCAAPVCSAWIQPCSDTSKSILSCDACTKHVCKVCRELCESSDPASHTCKPKSEAERALFETAKEHKWATCSTCNHMVELSEACNHMNCRCGAEFCYACSSDWDRQYNICSKGCPLYGPVQYQSDGYNLEGYNKEGLNRDGMTVRQVMEERRDDPDDSEIEDDEDDRDAAGNRNEFGIHEDLVLTEEELQEQMFLMEALGQQMDPAWQDRVAGFQQQLQEREDEAIQRANERLQEDIDEAVDAQWQEDVSQAHRDGVMRASEDALYAHNTAEAWQMFFAALRWAARDTLSDDEIPPVLEALRVLESNEELRASVLSQGWGEHISMWQFVNAEVADTLAWVVSHSTQRLTDPLGSTRRGLAEGALYSRNTPEEWAPLFDLARRQAESLGRGSNVRDALDSLEQNRELRTYVMTRLEGPEPVDMWEFLSEEMAFEVERVLHLIGPKMDQDCNLLGIPAEVADNIDDSFLDTLMMRFDVFVRRATDARVAEGELTQDRWLEIAGDIFESGLQQSTRMFKRQSQILFNLHIREQVPMQDLRRVYTQDRDEEALRRRQNMDELDAAGEALLEPDAQGNFATLNEGLINGLLYPLRSILQRVLHGAEFLERHERQVIARFAAFRFPNDLLRHEYVEVLRKFVDATTREEFELIPPHLLTLKSHLDEAIAPDADDAQTANGHDASDSDSDLNTNSDVDFDDDIEMTETEAGFVPYEVSPEAEGALQGAGSHSPSLTSNSETEADDHDNSEAGEEVPGSYENPYVIWDGSDDENTEPHGEMDEAMDDVHESEGEAYDSAEEYNDSEVNTDESEDEADDSVSEFHDCDDGDSEMSD